MLAEGHALIETAEQKAAEEAARGQVTYRDRQYNREKLLTMRRALIDKCEEVINTSRWVNSA